MSKKTTRPVCRAVVRAALLVSLATFISSPSIAQEDGQAAGANRELAARFTQDKMDRMIFDTRVQPHWLEGSDQFWYAWESSDGKRFWLVDPTRRSKTPVFDNDDMAAQLTMLTRDPYDAKHLPIEKIRWVSDNTAIQFDVVSSQDEERAESEGDEQEEDAGREPSKPKKKVHHFEYDLGSRQVRELSDFEAPADHPEWAALSPDKRWVVFGRAYDLYMMDAANYEEYLEKEKAKEDAGESQEEEDDASDDDEESDVDPDIEEVRLTTDGEEHYSYTRRQRGMTDKERAKKLGRRQPVSLTWSRDSAKFALVRSDRREVDELWVINAVAEPRPTLETYRYEMPGEEGVTQSEVWVFDIAARQGSKVNTDHFADQTVNILSARQFPRPDAEEPIPSLWLSESSDELYFGRISRDLKRYDVGMVDLASGSTRVLIEERLNTYIETQRVELLGTGELVWWSERDGWGHYYLFGADGSLRNRITSGPFSTRRIEGIDETNRVLYFTANAHEEGEDPYYTHLYRVRLDGTGMTLLNPGDANHQTSISESNGYFVDNSSRIDTVPMSVLRDGDGEAVMELEQADLSLLMEAGYEFPEPFMAKADDGVTNLFGVMYKPFDFDEERRYPIIAYVYPGPQTEAVTKSFNTRAQNVHLAQLGFVVIEVGNRGGHPARSKWYHNYGYGDLRDYGLADKKTAVEQLALRHDYVDIDRVGIFGHSGGGFMSTAAMLVYPDFFKVAVSSSGNHENQIYNRWWSEKHHGVTEVTDDEGNVSFEYDIETNSQLAKNLKGKLLLTTGDIDNNVHPSLTYRMAHALIKANKRFDFFVFPGERHGYRETADYWAWLRAEYFSEHLLGDRPGSVDIEVLNREIEMTGEGPRRR